MKLKRYLVLAAVPLLAAMGDRPAQDENGHTPYVRTQVPAARQDAAPVETPAVAAQLRILPAAEVDPAEFLWQARPVVVFSNTAADPAYLDQIRMLERDAAALERRDVVVIVDTEPAANGVWRQQLRPGRGFSLVLLDKDGQVKQRKPAPWSVREIGRAIDKLPLRRQEIGRAQLR